MRPPISPTGSHQTDTHTLRNQTQSAASLVQTARHSTAFAFDSAALTWLCSDNVHRPLETSGGRRRRGSGRGRGREGGRERGRGELEEREGAGEGEREGELHRDGEQETRHKSWAVTCVQPPLPVLRSVRAPVGFHGSLPLRGCASVGFHGC
eukprot:1018876-Rhodomonas_salina.1